MTYIYPNQVSFIGAAKADTVYVYVDGMPISRPVTKEGIHEALRDAGYRVVAEKKCHVFYANGTDRWIMLDQLSYDAFKKSSSVKRVVCA